MALPSDGRKRWFKSSIADRKGNICVAEFVEKTNESKKLTKVFVIMGEPKSSLFLCQRIRDYLDIDAVYPEENKEYELK